MDTGHDGQSCCKAILLTVAEPPEQQILVDRVQGETAVRPTVFRCFRVVRSGMVSSYIVRDYEKQRHCSSTRICDAHLYGEVSLEKHVIHADMKLTPMPEMSGSDCNFCCSVQLIPQVAKLISPSVVNDGEEHDHLGA